MKLLLILLFSLSTGASVCDEYQAQIIADVVSVETDSLTFCRAKVSYNSIKVFNPYGDNQYIDGDICPLYRQEVVTKGIDFPLINGHDCEVPDEINGVIYKMENSNKISVE